MFPGTFPLSGILTTAPERLGAAPPCAGHSLLPCRSRCSRDSRGGGGGSVGRARGSPRTLGSPRSPLRSAAPGTGRRGASGASGGLCPAAGSSGGRGPVGAALLRGQGLEQSSRLLSPWRREPPPDREQPLCGGDPPIMDVITKEKSPRTLSPHSPDHSVCELSLLVFFQIIKN